MREYICKEEPAKNGGYLVIARELIRCKDCKNWRPTGEVIGKCVMLSNGTCCCCEASADFFCGMAERKEESDVSEG